MQATEPPTSGTNPDNPDALSHVEIVKEVLVLPRGMTMSDFGNDHHFALTVQWRGVQTENGRGGYGVTHQSRWLSRAGNWGHPQAFQQKQYRWATLEEALVMAHKYVDTLTLSGRTFSEWRAEFAAQEPSAETLSS